MIEAAQGRGWDVYTMTLDDLFVEGALPMALMDNITIDRKKTPYFKVRSRAKKSLNSLNFILMRKDPPYDIEYVFATSILDLVDQNKTIISNRPESLRSFNEKFLVNYLPEFMPPSLFTRNREKMMEFVEKHRKIVAKPMDFMGGRGIFVIDHKDLNRSVILETLTENFSKTIVLQKYLPEISKGDRRIIVIGGEAIPHVLVRKPSKTDHRGNLAAGATANYGKLTTHEKRIVESLKPFFNQHGMHFVGLDLIGDYVTEVNITSPTGFVQLDQHFKISIADMYLEHLESFLR
ncbi:MAG: glutathione synthase, partial [Proteobacteria bacterium]|nr:glutathione synthase [Pseudomonadota bacterium]